MTTKTKPNVYEWRAYDGDEWEPFTAGIVWGMEDVAYALAEESWDNGYYGDASEFEFLVEVREILKPEKIVKFCVTADYSVDFYSREVKK